MKSISRLSKGPYLNRGAVFLLVAALIAGMAACGQVTPPPPAPGPGPGYVEVLDWNGLNAIRNNLSGNYRLMKDLDSQTDGYGDRVANQAGGWQPIGTSDARFTGTFDGRGHEIRNLFITRPDENDIGLFGYVGEGGVVKNIGVDAVVVGGQNVGALVGSNWRGTVRSDITPELAFTTKSRGSVTGDDNVGGLVGYVWQGTVSVSWSSAAVSSAGPRRTGGLVGHNSMGGVISDSEYKGGVVTGQYQVGGLVGLNAGEVRSCKGTGTVTGVSGIGGVAGVNLRWGGLNGSSFDGTVNGGVGSEGLISLDEGGSTRRLSTDAASDGSYVGGLVGWNEGDVDGSSSNSAVAGQQYIGGLVGWNDFGGELSDEYNYSIASLLGYGYTGSLAEDGAAGAVRNSHASGTVRGDHYVGGLVGWNEGIVDSCYATGSVAGSQYVGGLVGWGDDSRGTVSRSFWDTASTGIAARDTDWGTGVTTSDMRNIDTYRALGWDICAVARDEINTACTWNIAPGSYPFLSGKEPIRYTLTISSTAGGSVTSPGEGTFTYDAGKVVSLVATPASGHRFVNWTASAGVFSDASAATTSFTMPGQGVTVTATFEATTPGAATIVKIAVAGPMSFPHGQHMMQGAQIAVDEIGEFTAGENTYEFQLVQVDTADLSGDIAATRLAIEAKIAEVDFVIGGLRTEHTEAVADVICKDNGKILLGLGAPGRELTERVQADFGNYKYFFRVWPINDYFLVTSTFRVVTSLTMILLWDPDLPFESMSDINVYVLAENADWNQRAVTIVENQFLPALGVNHVGTARPSPGASLTELLPTVADIAAKNTHVVMTLLEGQVGFSWAQARHQAGLPVISAGINTVAHMTAFGQLGAAALHEITLDTTASDVQMSPLTQPFLTAFQNKHNAYPFYTGVSAYDAIRVLKAAIQETGSLSSDAIAAAIPGLELDSVSGKIVFYPPAAIDLGSQQPGLRALSAAQAYDLYGDHLLAFYSQPSFVALEANWMTYVGDWTSPPHLPQDLAYGPAVGNTAIASQWQGTATAPIKVAVWPRLLLPAGTPIAQLKAMGLFDRWGNWNFQYPGTAGILIPQLFYDTWG